MQVRHHGRKKKKLACWSLMAKEGRGVRDISCTGRWDFDGVKGGP